MNPEVVVSASCVLCLLVLTELDLFVMCMCSRVTDGFSWDPPAPPDFNNWNHVSCLMSKTNMCASGWPQIIFWWKKSLSRLNS